jgi:aminoglycoside phosphotransferase (APT) family kinase protein
MTTKNNRIIGGRFVREDLAAVSAYLKVAALAVEKDILPALESGPAFAKNSAKETLVILKRLFWYIDGDDSDATPDFNSIVSQIASDQASFDALQSLATTAEEPRVEIDATLLQSTLRERIDGATNLTVSSFKLVAGGRSKLTALFKQSGCELLPEHLVLRLDWASAVTGTSVVTEYELLKRVHKAGLKVPEPFALVEDDNPLGAAFIIVSRLPGAPLGDIFQPPISESIALQLAEQFGKIHSIPLSDLEGLPAITEREYSADQLRETLAELCAVFDSLGDKNPIIVETIDLIEEGIDSISGPKTLVHSDLGFHNFLVDGENLSALLDWELAHFGNPANDLGYIRGDIEKMVSWHKFMVAYRAGGGPDLTDEEIDFYFLWALFRLYCLLLRARAGLVAGLVQDVSVAQVCADSIPRLLETLAKGIVRIKTSK